jgi:hypothetical protein
MKNATAPIVKSKPSSKDASKDDATSVLVKCFAQKDEIELKIQDLQRSIETLQVAKGKLAKDLYGRFGCGPFKWRGACYQVVRRRGTDDEHPEEGASYVFRGEGIRQPTLVG